MPSVPRIGYHLRLTAPAPRRREHCDSNMKLAVKVNPIRWAHWEHGGTGVTNINGNEAERCARYIQAALNIGMDGITVVNRAINGGEGCSLHDCVGYHSLSPFWDEVARLEIAPSGKP